jgi:hypothetical protein
MFSCLAFGAMLEFRRVGKLSANTIFTIPLSESLLMSPGHARQAKRTTGQRSVEAGGALPAFGLALSILEQSPRASHAFALVCYFFGNTPRRAIATTKLRPFRREAAIRARFAVRVAVVSSLQVCVVFQIRVFWAWVAQVGLVSLASLGDRLVVGAGSLALSHVELGHKASKCCGVAKLPVLAYEARSATARVRARRAVFRGKRARGARACRKHPVGAVLACAGCNRARILRESASFTF